MNFPKSTLSLFIASLGLETFHLRDSIVEDKPAITTSEPIIMAPQMIIHITGPRPDIPRCDFSVISRIAIKAVRSEDAFANGFFAKREIPKHPRIKKILPNHTPRHQQASRRRR